MKLVILAIGSRGDVQPCVALGIELRNAGYDVRFATHRRFEHMVQAAGLEYATVSADFQSQLTSDAGQKWTTQRGAQPYLQGLGNTVGIIGGQVMDDFWTASDGADAVLSNFTPALSYPVATRRNVPLIQIYLQPLGMHITPSQHNVLYPPAPAWSGIGQNLYNLATHALFSLNGLPLLKGVATAYQNVTVFAPHLRELAGLLNSNSPELYAYSRHVVDKPASWPDHTHVTGYWFLDHPGHWQPPHDLVAFIETGPAPIYVGFGSMPNKTPEELRHLILKALQMSGQRGIVASGWGDAESGSAPDGVYYLAACPHDWLFPQMATVVHHGGAGTTAAGLRAGIPTITVPHFGDQPFWGERIHKLGVGPKPVPRDQLTAEKLADAILIAMNDATIRNRASQIGEKIHAERGTEMAVSIIDNYLRRLMPSK